MITRRDMLTATVAGGAGYLAAGLAPPAGHPLIPETIPQLDNKVLDNGIAEGISEQLGKLGITVSQQTIAQVVDKIEIRQRGYLPTITQLCGENTHREIVVG